MQDSNLTQTVIETDSMVSTILEALVRTIDVKSGVIKVSEKITVDKVSKLVLRFFAKCD